MAGSKSSSGSVRRCEAAACLFMLQPEPCEEAPAIWNINRSFSIPFTRRAEMSHSEKGRMQCKLAPHQCLHGDMRYRSIKYWICFNTKSSYGICLYFCFQFMLLLCFRWTSQAAGSQLPELIAIQSDLQEGVKLLKLNKSVHLAWNIFNFLTLYLCITVSCFTVDTRSHLSCKLVGK